MIPVGFILLYWRYTFSCSMETSVSIYPLIYYLVVATLFSVKAPGYQAIMVRLNGISRRSLLTPGVSICWLYVESFGRIIVRPGRSGWRRSQVPLKKSLAGKSIFAGYEYAVVVTVALVFCWCSKSVGPTVMVKAEDNMLTTRSKLEEE
jgi:hypothetical protein